MIVEGAGHLVPMTQLQGSRQVLRDFIDGSELKCHNAKKGCSLDEALCDLMNNCNGHGVCSNGRCECEDGYKSADCSAMTTDFAKEFGRNAAAVDLKGTHWNFFTFRETGKHYRVHVRSDKKLEVYLLKGHSDIPTRDNFDVMHRGSDVVMTPITNEFTVAIYNTEMTEAKVTIEEAFEEISSGVQNGQISFLRDLFNRA